MARVNVGRMYRLFFRKGAVISTMASALDQSTEAARVKRELKNSFDCRSGCDGAPLKMHGTALQNPLALHAAYRVESGQFTIESMRFIEECKKSARLIILAEHAKWLRDYYEERKKVDDKLGRLYRSLSFSDFSRRLFEKRYKAIYLDGRLVAERDNEDFYEMYVVSANNKSVLYDVINREYGNIPVLIKYDNLVYIYGRSENGQWDITRIDEDKLDPSLFPVDGQVKKTGPSEIDRSIYQHIEQRRGHIPQPSIVYDLFGNKGKALIERVGTESDTDNKYRDYLTLEEMVLSPLVLPQAVSIVIGTGSRDQITGHDKNTWISEFEDSIDISIFSYPAAAEFRDGMTSHFDFLFIIRPEKYTALQESQLEMIRNNQPLLHAARKIYGDSLAFEAFSAENGVALKSHDGQRYYLNISAWKTRTKNTLRQILLCADAQMQAARLGKVFQLKGMGMGAFSFSHPESRIRLKLLFIEAVKETLQENRLQYIDHVNLLGEYPVGSMGGFTIHDVRLTAIDMNPTECTGETGLGKTGGTIFCGDSASQVGNEGNIGMERSSSDDPATLYSLFDPYILNHSRNPNLQDSNNLLVLANNQEWIPVDIYSPENKPSFSLPGSRL